MPSVSANLADEFWIVFGFIVFLSIGCLYGVWLGCAISLISLSSSAFLFSMSLFRTIETFALESYGLGFGLGLVRSCEFPLCGVIRHLVEWLLGGCGLLKYVLVLVFSEQVCFDFFGATVFFVRHCQLLLDFDG